MLFSDSKYFDISSSDFNSLVIVPFLCAVFSVCCIEFISIFLYLICSVFWCIDSFSASCDILCGMIVFRSEANRLLLCIIAVIRLVVSVGCCSFLDLGQKHTGYQV